MGETENQPFTFTLDDRGVGTLTLNRPEIHNAFDDQLILELTKLSEFSDRVVFSSSIVRGIEYYTGAIFEANLLFKVKNKKGEKVEFGSVGGGGRYDDLVARFTQSIYPATGVSIGLDRLLYAINQKEKEKVKNNNPVVICVFDEKQISEKNILDFHLSHRTNPQFQYKPSKSTSKIIWRYLSSSNLLENIDEIDLEDIEELSLIEQATHEGNYSEKELLDLYKRFQFTINQLLNVKDAYKLLPTVQGRALLYQRLLLSKDPEQILDLSSKLKDSFVSENIENAFNKELSKMLSKINVEDILSNHSTFYTKNLINQNPKKSKIKINNKIIYQSKLLNYFRESYDIKKVEKDTNDLIKKIKKNKNYFVSTKDLMLLESLQSDGVEISKKYLKLFQFNQSNIPTDLQLLINNNEIGLVLLRFVEIVGEDEFVDLNSDTIYFMVDVLNQLNIDSIRNNILLKVLPLKI